MAQANVEETKNDLLINLTENFRNVLEDISKYNERASHEDRIPINDALKTYLTDVIVAFCQIPFDQRKREIKLLNANQNNENAAAGQEDD